MAKRGFFAFVCVVLCVHATAWGQGPGFGPQNPYGPPAGPWAVGAGGGQGVVQAAYQTPAMQPAPMAAMQPGPMPQPMPEGMAPCDPCCLGSQPIPCWEAFGDFLYIRPRDANVAYGVPFTGPYNVAPGAAVPIQAGPPGTASIDFHPGWRVGFSKAVDECNAVEATFSHYEGEDQDSIPAGAYPIRSMVAQPSTYTGDWAQAASDYQMIYSVADVDFRWTFENQNDTRLSLLAGARYAGLDQRLDSTFMAADTQNVHSQVNFDGAGLRIGFDGERRTPYGLVFYGRAAASLVAGTFRGAYTEINQVAGPQVLTGYDADRVVPILDCELGSGLSLWNDKLRITAGYSFSGWFNIVRTDQFIGAVQANNFTGMSSTLTFDGFVGRVEMQF